MGKQKWQPCKSCQIAVAVWNYSSQAEHHLSLSVGDLVCVLEECGEWYRGYLYYYPSRSGVFPMGFVQHKESKALTVGNKEYHVPREDPVALEAKECLHQWKRKLFAAYAGGSRKDYTHLIHYSEDLMVRRWNLLHTNATMEALQGMKAELTAEIDRTNNLCKVPLSPRDDTGQLLDAQSISLHQLLRVHQLRQDEVNRKVPRTGWNKKKEKACTCQSHHIYLMIKGIDHTFPEPCELFFFLYDSISGKQLSERFLVSVSKTGVSSRRNSVKPMQYHALFTDLNDNERNSVGLYLICQVIRKGKMLLDDKKNSSQHQFRRPHAVGVTDVRQIVGDASSGGERVSAFLFGEDDDIYQTVHTMSLQLCSSHETDFPTLHTSLIRKSGSSKTSSHRTGGGVIALSLRAFQGDLQQLKKDYPYLEKKNAVLVNRLGYPSVILPGLVRNDIYVTLEHGVFEKGSKRAERNVEVAIAVVNSSGQILPQCIVLAAGATPISEYESFIFYHNNYPKWSETFKLAIPLDSIQDCHLRIAFRHVAKNEGKDKIEKTFSFAYMKIMREDGSIIPDGTHDLNMYKVDPKQKWYDPSMYLQLAPVRDRTRTEKRMQTIAVESVPVSSLSTLSRSGRENIFISTLTCSTKLTQKVEMLHLLKWRTKKLHELPSILMNVVSIDGGEIVKFLQDTLDCLFAILTSNSNMYGEAVFNAMVSIMGRLSEERYKQFIPVLDMYLEDHFSSTMAYKVLIWYFDQRVQNCHSSESCQLKLVEALKSMHFIFRFIIQSHKLFGRDQHFPEEIRSCFSSFNNVLSMTEDRFHGIHRVQGDILRNLPSILPEIMHVFPAREISQLLSEVLDSIRNVHPSIPGSKMDFILAVFDSPVELMSTQGAREGFMQTVVSHLISHLTHTLPQTSYRLEDQGNKGCMNCIGRVLETLEKDNQHVTFTDIDNATPLLQPLLSKALEFNDGKSNPLRAEVLVCLVGVLRVMKEQHYAVYVDSLKERDSQPGDSHLRTFITNLAEVLQNLIVQPPHPKEWLYLHYAQNSVIVKVLRNISKALLNSFLNDKSFIPQVWDVYFSLCTSFATQPCLQLEELSDLHRARMKREFGDMRVEVVKQIIVMWETLKDKKGNFIPNFIGSFLSLTLIKNKVIRNLSLPLIQDVMKCEQQSSQNFRRVETEVFDKIDMLLSDGLGDEDYRELFRDILMKKCKEEVALCKAGGLVFIDSVCRLIGLLLDYRSVQNDATHRGKRMGCMFNLLKFYDEIEKEELYIRYIYKLAELHERDDNFTEAGFTLLLHADKLEWTTEEDLPAEGCFPAQTQLDRKERLYNDAIRLFDKGKMWESGIRLCKELAQLYEEQLYDYQKLSGILRTEADFFQRMITEVRVENEYFLVGYYGKGSPLFLRNKMFIHRGQPYERLQPFIKRLMDEFPSAVLMKQKTTEPPDTELQNSPGLFLLVRNVQPIVEEESLKDKGMPDKIAAYYKTNNVSRFRQDRPFHVGERDKDCEFATLWVERTTFTTSKVFPSVVTYLEVCDTTSVKLNPLELALQTVESKTKDILTLTRDMGANPNQSINPLSMLLKGVIDAAVMGGISHYDKIFFVPSYVKEHPDHQEKVRKLKTLIEEQVDVLRNGLTLHSERVPSDLQAFHQDLEMRFEGFKDIVFPERRSRTLSTVAPQVPKPPGSKTLGRPLPRPPTSTVLDKKLSRRPTDPKSNSTSIESKESPKIRRSATTKSRTSLQLTPSDRVTSTTESIDSGFNSPLQALPSSRSSSNVTSDIVTGDDEDEEDFDDEYETIKFDELQRKMVVVPVASAPVGSAPAYPAPHPPHQQHAYTQDELDDLHDYEKVRLGQMYTPERPEREHAKEFAVLPCMQRDTTPEKASGTSPHKYSSSGGARVASLTQSLPPHHSVAAHNPPNNQNGDRLAVFNFPSKQKAPATTAISQTSGGVSSLEEARQLLLNRARQSVISDLAREAEKTSSSPQATNQHFSVASTTQNSLHQPQKEDKPYFDHLFPASQPSTPATSASVDLIDNDTYWDHLAGPVSGKGAELSLPLGTPSDHIHGEYALATSPQGTDDVDSMYDVIRDPDEIASRERSPGKMQSPPKPMPYSKRAKSPSPGRDSGSAVQVPPPVPKKRGSQYMTVGQHFNSTNDRDKTPPIVENSEVGRGHGTKASSKLHFDSTSHIYANQTPPVAMPRSRSSTLASGMSPSSPATPVPVARKSIVDSGNYQDQSPLTTPPPRPPKSTDPFPPALPPKSTTTLPPPSLPPKGKPSLPPKDSAPILPPKPAARMHY